MNLIVEVFVTDAHERIKDDILSELRAMLSGKGLKVADAATFEASEESRAALSAMAGSSAAIRVCEVG
jgi:ABC-type uncharacterized transport system substrate-binding protein